MNWWASRNDRKEQIYVRLQNELKQSYKDLIRLSFLVVKSQSAVAVDSMPNYATRPLLSTSTPCCPSRSQSTNCRSWPEPRRWMCGSCEHRCHRWPLSSCQQTPYWSYESRRTLRKWCHRSRTRLSPEAWKQFANQTRWTRKEKGSMSKYWPVSGDVVASEWIAGLFELSLDQLLDKLFHKWSMLSINVVHAFKALQNALGDGDRVLVVEQIGLSESAASVRTNSGQKLDKTTIFTMNKVVKMEARVSSYSPLSLNQWGHRVSAIPLSGC